MGAEFAISISIVPLLAAGLITPGYIILYMLSRFTTGRPSFASSLAVSSAYYVGVWAVFDLGSVVEVAQRIRNLDINYWAALAVVIAPVGIGVLAGVSVQQGWSIWTVYVDWRWHAANYDTAVRHGFAGHDKVAHKASRKPTRSCQRTIGEEVHPTHDVLVRNDEERVVDLEEKPVAADSRPWSSWLSSRNALFECTARRTFLVKSGMVPSQVVSWLAACQRLSASVNRSSLAFSARPLTKPSWD